MKLPKNTTYYLMAFVLFVLLKFLYASANTNDLYFLLNPLNTVIGFVLDSSSIYYSDIGFFHKTLKITIDKSCSGFNFLLLSFLITYCSSLKVFKSNVLKIIGLPITFIVSYIFTLMVNASRILSAIFIEKQTNLNYSWLHEAEGIFIYVSFLILLYFVINHIQRNILKHHEKLT